MRSGRRLRPLSAHGKGDHRGSGPGQRRRGVLITGRRCRAGQRGSAAACRPSDLLTVNIDQIPLLKDAMGPGIHIKPLRLDPEKGQVVLMATMAPGCLLPIHYHTGTAEVYTFSGCWRYAEYPDQPQTAGTTCTSPAARCTPSTAPRTTPRTPWCCCGWKARKSDSTRTARFHSHQRRDLHSARDRNRVGGAGHRAGGLHPRRRRRCGQVLMETVIMPAGL